MAKNQPTVLLVEDNPDLREVEELVLADAGYLVVTVPAGADPVESAAQTRPQVIVFGIRPGEPSAWQTMDRLLTDPKTSAVPVVVISTAERMTVEAQAAPNVRATVVAPYDIQALQRAVAVALGNPPPAAVLPPPIQPVRRGCVVAADELNRRARRIVLATLRRLQQVEPYRERFPELSHGLIDNLAMILGAIIEGLRRGLPPEQALAVPDVERSIKEHDRLRLSQGIGVALVVKEDEILRNETESCFRELVGEHGLGAADVMDICQDVTRYFDELIRIVVTDYCTNIVPSPNAPQGE